MNKLAIIFGILLSTLLVMFIVNFFLILSQRNNFEAMIISIIKTRKRLDVDEELFML